MQPIHKMQQISANRNNLEIHDINLSAKTESIAHDEDKSQRCEYFCCTAPECMQRRCRNPPCLLTALCFAAFFQNLLCNGFINGVITTLERRYKFSSSDSGILSAIYDIMGIFLLMPVGYIGGNWGKKSRWVATGMVFLGLGSLVFTMPQIFSGKYEYFIPNVTTCSKRDVNTADINCKMRSQDDALSLKNYRWVFWFGQMLNGIGTTPMYTLATVMIHESLNNEKAAMYIGIYETMSLLGPAVGFVVSGLLLNIYVDVGEPHPGLTVDNQSVWVGAWWVGFVISTVTCFLSAISLIGFPKQLPGAREIQRNRPVEAYKNDENIELPKGLKQYGSFMRSLLKNPAYIFLCLATATEFFIVGGYATFGAKAMEVVFSLKASTASMIIGGLVAIGGSFGVFLGGLVIKLAKLSLEQIMRAGIIVCACTIPFVLIFLLHCNTPDIAGQSRPNKMLELKQNCNGDCHCSLDYTAFNPVCIRNKETHFSPCYAGCTDQKENDNSIYTNCTCMNNDHTTEYLEATTGACVTESCTKLYIFVTCLGIIIFLTFSLTTPLVVTTLRVVKPKEQALSLGIKLMIARIFGSVPGPIVFGLLFDTTCILWTEDCGERGNCAFYNGDTVRYVFLGATGILKCLSLTFIILGYYFYKSRKGYTPTTTV